MVKSFENWCAWFGAVVACFATIKSLALLIFNAVIAFNIGGLGAFASLLSAFVTLAPGSYEDNVILEQFGSNADVSAVVDCYQFCNCYCGFDIMFGALSYFVYGAVGLWAGSFVFKLWKGLPFKMA